MDLRSAPDVEYDDGCITLSWMSDDKGRMFSIRIGDNCLIGGITSKEQSGGHWRVPLPDGWVTVVTPKVE